MALKFNFTDPATDAAYPNAYAKIASFSGTKDSFYCHVNIYASQDARNANKSPITSADFNFGSDLLSTGVTVNGTLLMQITTTAYDLLKTFSFFSGAVDA